MSRSRHSSVAHPSAPSQRLQQTAVPMSATDIDEPPSPTLFTSSAFDSAPLRSRICTDSDSAVASAVESLPVESATGNIEYKWKLTAPSPDRLTHLTTQMNYRLSEGRGECIYEIGVLDSGWPEGLSDEELSASLSVINRMATTLQAEMRVLHIAQGVHGKVAEVMVRSLAQQVTTDIRIAVVGDVDVGKSTLVGVLTNNKLDNGKGLARQHVFKHRHELLSGYTSDISSHTVGFTADGNITNHTVPHFSSFATTSTSAMILENAVKTVTLLDMAGRVDYLRTTATGLAGGGSDYVLLVISAIRGWTDTSEEHLRLSLSLQIPIVVVLTKVDLVNQIECENVLNNIKKKLNNIIILQQIHDVNNYITNITTNNNNIDITPLICVSSVTGIGLDIFQRFLYLLPKRKDWSVHQQAPAEFAINDCFDVMDVGPVVSGTVMAGVIRTNNTTTNTSEKASPIQMTRQVVDRFHNDSLLLGPMIDGSFVPVIVKSIHMKRAAANRVVAGQTASLAVALVTPQSAEPSPNLNPAIADVGDDDPPISLPIRRGMFIVHSSLSPRASYCFEAVIEILHHPTTFKPPYQPLIHMQNIRQSAQLTTLQPTSLQSKQRGRATFRFCYHAEYVKVNDKFLIRESRAIGLGIVCRVIYDDGEEKSRDIDDSTAQLSGTTSNKSRRRSRAKRLIVTPPEPIEGGMNNESALISLNHVERKSDDNHDLDVSDLSPSFQTLLSRPFSLSPFLSLSPNISPSSPLSPSIHSSLSDPTITTSYNQMTSNVHDRSTSAARHHRHVGNNQTVAQYTGQRISSPILDIFRESMATMTGPSAVNMTNSFILQEFVDTDSTERSLSSSDKTKQHANV